MQTFGPYNLHKRLAVGGMAEIFLAKKGDEEQWYALKIMLPHNAGNAEHESMFMDEAKLLRRMRHPNIVAALDLLREEGRVAVALEYVPGNDLSVVLRRMREQKIKAPFDLVIDVGLAIATGLHHAHTMTGEDGNPLYLVHRDVTPENVLMGVDGTVKIADFGVAKARGFNQVETKTGIIKGKLRYMAPEYATGNMQDVRSDVFSLGLCIYEMLTGQPAYNDETPGPQLVEAIKNATITPPTALRTDCPPLLERLLLKSLAVNPQDRFTTAESMRRALEKVRASVPTGKIGLGDFLISLGIQPAVKMDAAKIQAPAPIVLSREPTDRITLEPTGQMEAAAPPLRVADKPELVTLSGYHRIVQREVKMEPRSAKVVEHQHPSKMSGLIDLNAIEIDIVPVGDDDDDDDDDVETSRLAPETTDRLSDAVLPTDEHDLLDDVATGRLENLPEITEKQAVIEREDPTPAAEPARPQGPVSLFDEDEEFQPTSRPMTGGHAAVGAQVQSDVAPGFDASRSAHTQPTPVVRPPADDSGHGFRPPRLSPVQGTPALNPALKHQQLLPLNQGFAAGHVPQSFGVSSMDSTDQTPILRPTAAGHTAPAFTAPATASAAGFSANASLPSAGISASNPPLAGQQATQQPLGVAPGGLASPGPMGQAPSQSVPSPGIPATPPSGPAPPTVPLGSRKPPSDLFVKLGVVGVLILVLLLLVAISTFIF